ncbi:MAG: PP2C family protein-serine/threonine phosphatase [Streptosporangiaceae bacterium]|jgi:serine phosphatase RsbU (regulator of sigma subunit)
MMTSETIEVPPRRQDATGVTSRASGMRDAGRRPASLPGPVAAGTGPAGRGLEARLEAELAAERHVVLELQRAILPLHDQPFRLPGLRAAVRYLPASAASRVGGDWYITAEMPGGHVLVAIGDVAGHGLAAAAGMARLRGALAGLAITGAPPARLVGWLNDLVRHVGPEHTGSVMAGYFDPVNRLLTWAQAGHPPPVLIRGAWARPLDPPEGILLGAGAADYGTATLALARDDVLLLYSDGLIERRYWSIEDGLAALTAATRGRTKPERVIAAAVRALGSADAEDDTCLVALQVR